jgi:acetyl esterase/lipase
MDIIRIGTTDNGRRRPRRNGASALLGAAFVLLTACSGSGPTVVVEGEALSFVDEVFEFSVDNDLEYGSALDENGVQEILLLNLFQPTDDSRTLRPAVIWLHGGSYKQGHRAQMTEFAQRFARRGFVSASVSYRLRENAVFDYTDPDDSLGNVVKREAQHDVQAAVRWLRANAADLRIHASHIYVVGYSAGGTASLRVAAGSDDPGSSGNAGLSSRTAGTVGIAASLEPGMLEAALGSTLLIHGENDAKVPIAGVTEACALVTQCELVVVPLGEHDMLTPAKETIIAEAAAFLHRLTEGQ